MRHRTHWHVPQVGSLEPLFEMLPLESVCKRWDRLLQWMVILVWLGGRKALVVDSIQV